MLSSERPKAVLLLVDGTRFEGRAIGATGTTTGEICFNTGMTGYQEIFTDPSYYGQIMVTATSHIGNYGVNEDEVESEGIKISGLVCKKFSETYSRARSNGSLQEFLERDGIVGISDIDTRALVRHIRDSGAMNAIISSEGLSDEELKERLDKIPCMDGLELASKVSTEESYSFGNSGAQFKVALLDIGVKKSIISCLADRGCYVKVFPMNTSFEEIKAFAPNGVLLSNGPGDPAPLTNVIETVGKIVEAGYPVFGICLGHQVLALSQGLKTEKMHNGHRGINHPIKNLLTGHCEVTSQNHGFVVKRDEVEDLENVEMTHVHLNDKTLAGLRVKDRPVFSVQYHPEASPGPHDARYLFDQFIANMEEYKSEIVPTSEALNQN